MNMFAQLEQLETELYRRLNGIVEPLVRAGFGSPGPWPTGVILLETTGRKSGRTINVPVMAAALGELIVVGTVRGRRSQWVRNLAATPKVRYWAHGRPNEATAIVIAGDRPDANHDRLPGAAFVLPPLLRSFAFGKYLTLAVLMPAAA